MTDDALEVLGRAHGLSGHTFAELASAAGLALPRIPARAKGFAGRLVERALGAAGPSKRATDFASCELKTLPVDPRGRVRESTFVCHVALKHLCDVPWHQSWVRAKLEQVVFVPVESAADLPFAERRVGRAFLWRMSADEEARLREDYDAIVERVAGGRIETLDARVGSALQVRPKAASSRVRVRAYDMDDGPLAVGPRAFYLRATFTAALLRATGHAIAAS